MVEEVICEICGKPIRVRDSRDLIGLEYGRGYAHRTCIISVRKEPSQTHDPKDRGEIGNRNWEKKM